MIDGIKCYMCDGKLVTVDYSKIKSRCPKCGVEYEFRMSGYCWKDSDNGYSPEDYIPQIEKERK